MTNFGDGGIVKFRTEPFNPTSLSTSTLTFPFSPVLNYSVKKVYTVAEQDGIILTQIRFTRFNEGRDKFFLKVRCENGIN
jgi:hypothetical protein